MRKNKRLSKGVQSRASGQRMGGARLHDIRNKPHSGHHAPLRGDIINSTASHRSKKGNGLSSQRVLATIEQLQRPLGSSFRLFIFSQCSGILLAVSGTQCNAHTNTRAAPIFSGHFSTSCPPMAPHVPEFGFNISVANTCPDVVVVRPTGAGKVHIPTGLIRSLIALDIYGT